MKKNAEQATIVREDGCITELFKRHEYLYYIGNKGPNVNELNLKDVHRL